MGKFARKVFVNQIKQIDKDKKQGCSSNRMLRTKDIHRAMQVTKEADRLSPEDVRELKAMGRGHALWIHMLVLKNGFSFTGRMLVEFRARYSEVFDRAVDSEKDGAAKCIKYTITQSHKEDAGNMGYTDFEQYSFDPDGTTMNDVESKYGKRSLKMYKKLERCFEEFNKAEVVTMLVLFDYYGFRLKRLKRFINTVRKAYNQGAGKAPENIAYLEKLCKTSFTEFDCIRNGQFLKMAA